MIAQRSQGLRVEPLPKTEETAERWLSALSAVAVQYPEAFGTPEGLTEGQAADARGYLFAAKHNNARL